MPKDIPTLQESFPVCRASGHCSQPSSLNAQPTRPSDLRGTAFCPKNAQVNSQRTGTRIPSKTQENDRAKPQHRFVRKTQLRHRGQVYKEVAGASAKAKSMANLVAWEDFGKLSVALQSYHLRRKEVDER